MLPKEIIKKIKRIEITTRHQVDDFLGGEYQSVFKGRGMEFHEVREYQIGDDIRTIDWNVTARMGAPFVKKYLEERELTVIFIVDASSSSDFGTFKQMKGEIAAEICALLAFSAIKNNDRVGLMIFTDTIEKYVPPKKGKDHVLRVIRELLYFRPRGRRTDIGSALEYLGRVIKKKSVVFLISDFFASDYEPSLKVLNKKHDLIAVSITDPRERTLPPVGFIELEDAETGETLLVDTSSPATRDEFSDIAGERTAERKKMFKSLNIDAIEILTDEPYFKPLAAFFRQRARRLRH
jgi:uncharacterized protein (DUF58 family)